MLTILFSEPMVYELLYDFAERYYKATHNAELTKIGAAAVTDVLVTILLAIFTAGTGAVANIAAKFPRLAKIFNLLEKITNTLKRMGPQHRLPKKRKSGRSLGHRKKSKPDNKKGVPEPETPKKKTDVENKGKKEYLDKDNNDGPKTTDAKKTGPLSAEQANEPHLARGNRPPYAAGTRARDIVLKEDRVFLRVHGEGNKARSWMVRPDEIKGLTPAQIKDKLALPEMPTHISEVHVPAGTRIRVGTVGAQEGWGTGGKIQYELLQRLPESAFKNTRPLQ